MYYARKIVTMRISKCHMVREHEFSEPYNNCFDDVFSGIHYNEKSSVWIGMDVAENQVHQQEIFDARNVPRL